MSPKIWWFTQPEGGAEAEVVLERLHSCANAKTMRKALDDDTADLLEFPLGVAGRTVPQGIPFVVTAIHPCKVCGALPSMWAAWSKKLYG